MEATPVVGARPPPGLDELDELSIMELRDELEEEGLDEDAIDEVRRAPDEAPRGGGQAPAEAVLGVVAAQPGRDARGPSPMGRSPPRPARFAWASAWPPCASFCCGDCG